MSLTPDLHQFLTPEELQELDLLTEPRWTPLPGPQTAAYHSEADILLYGGAAGGGKTDLMLGLAHQQHLRTIIYRAQFSQLAGIATRGKEIFKGASFNGAELVFRLKDDRYIQLGAVERIDDATKYMGRPYDLVAFDEIPHFPGEVFRFLMGWNRTTVPGQRTRVVCAGNPPTNAIGDWVLKFWAPWLDPTYPDPAQPGELRWYYVHPVTGEDVPTLDGSPVTIGDETVQPKSRTFIPARVEDNPYLMETGYKAQLQSLPEPLRSKMLKGDFGLSQADDAMQVIPTAWVIEAQNRWTAMERDGIVFTQEHLSAVGVDVARGGQDRTVLTPQYQHGGSTRYGEQICVPGRQTPDGPSVCALLIQAQLDSTLINVDSIGVGAAVMDSARQLGMRVVAFNSSEASDAMDRSRKFGFYNKRSEWWWRLREDLDPELGLGLAIPPDRQLLADLTAPRWDITRNKIQVESKDKVKERIKRSPDKGDSLVYAHSRVLVPGAGFLDYAAAILQANPKV